MPLKERNPNQPTFSPAQKIKFGRALGTPFKAEPAPDAISFNVSQSQVEESEDDDSKLLESLEDTHRELREHMERAQRERDDAITYVEKLVSEREKMQLEIISLKRENVDLKTAAQGAMLTSPEEVSSDPIDDNNTGESNRGRIQPPIRSIQELRNRNSTSGYYYVYLRDGRYRVEVDHQRIRGRWDSPEQAAAIAMDFLNNQLSPAGKIKNEKYMNAKDFCLGSQTATMQTFFDNFDCIN